MMFDASAPPRSVTFTPVARLKVLEIWNIQVSVALPLMTNPVAALTELDHLYSPGRRISPPMLPLARLTKFGFTLPLASVKAVVISEMAVVSWEGVGDVYDAANSFPVTCWDVENVPLLSSVKEKPVNAVDAIGLTPMFPVIEEGGTVDTPVSASIAKLPAVRKLTAVGPRASTLSIMHRRPMANLRILVLRSKSLTAWSRMSGWKRLCSKSCKALAGRLG